MSGYWNVAIMQEKGECSMIKALNISFRVSLLKYAEIKRALLCVFI